MCDSLEPSASPECPCDLGVAQKSFSRVFWGKLSRKHGFSGSLCFQIRISLLNAPAVNLWKLDALRRYLPNSGWLWLTFEMTKFSFPAKFRLSYDSYLEPPLLLLSVGCSLPIFSGFCYMLSGVA